MGCSYINCLLKAKDVGFTMNFDDQIFTRQVCDHEKISPRWPTLLGVSTLRWANNKKLADVRSRKVGPRVRTLHARVR